MVNEIVNTTTIKYRKDVSFEAEIADSFMKRFLGYMFRKEPHHEILIIKPCNSIHTFFMKFNIDVLFVNENMEVIKKVENLKPGKMILPVKGACIVIEGKTGSFNMINEGSIIKNPI